MVRLALVLSKIKASAMIWPFKKRFATPDGVYAIYDVIVAQSRQRKFYSDLQISDNVSGRFDMICLHMCLVLHHLRKEGGTKLSQDLFDLFFADMDRSLRELGVGDIAVPKRIEKMGGVFYGLLEKVTEALDANDQEQLADVINRNLFAEENIASAAEIADYLKRLAKHLEPQDTNNIAAGRLDLGVAP